MATVKKSKARSKSSKSTTQKSKKFLELIATSYQSVLSGIDAYDEAIYSSDQNGIIAEATATLRTWLVLERRITKTLISSLCKTLEKPVAADAIAKIDIGRRHLKHSAKQITTTGRRRGFSDYLFHARIVLLREDLERQFQRWDSAVPKLEEVLDLESMAMKVVSDSRIRSPA